MKSGVLKRLLEEYGQAVCICRADGAPEVVTRAFLQPQDLLPRTGAAEMPTPLGATRGARFSYFGAGEVSLAAMEDGWIECHGAVYEVVQAQEIWLGDEVSHWQATLKLREGVGV